ncbi:hypothetical protein QP938_06575 [Porticoccaceae bacterium LTM1]|nr:hypothetical protein QP938_06575 [Porticoccaceae bacterium LTM1]
MIRLLMIFAIVQILCGCTPVEIDPKAAIQPAESSELWLQINASIRSDDDIPLSGLLTSATQPNQFTLKQVKNQTLFIQLLSRALGMDNFSYEAVDLPDGKLVSLIYDDVSIWEKFGYGLFYRQGNWYWFYCAGVSSKNFTPMFDLSLIGRNRVEAILCIEDCSWWGKNALVVLDMERLEIELVEPVEMTYADWVNQ